MMRQREARHVQRALRGLWCVAPLLSLMFVAAPRLCAAPVPTPKGPLHFTLHLDRAEYIDREPIFCDLRLTNVSGKELGYSGGAVTSRTHLIVTPEAGEAFELWYGSGHMKPLSKWTFVRLGAGRADSVMLLAQDMRGRCRLSPGRYTIRAVCDAGYSTTGRREDATPQQLTSNTVRITVRPPTEAEKGAVDFLAGLEKRWEVGKWTVVWDEVRRLEKMPGAPRLSAFAQLALGEGAAALSPDGDIYVPSDADKDRRRLRSVLASTSASDYMKGVAAYRLALSGYDRLRPGTAHRTTEALRLVIEQHPDTHTANEAQRAIAAIRAMEAKPKAKR